MGNKDMAQPQLKNLDHYFENMKKQQGYKQTVSIIPFNELTPYKGFKFSLYEGERFDDMVESIKKHGILMPVIARRSGEILEILSGHNRVNAGKAAGLNEAPVIILENIPDELAEAYVIETNLMQRSFTDMSHSERAAVIFLHYSKMFSQGKRNDIAEQIKMLENPNEDNETLPKKEPATKSRTDEKIGEKYKLSKNTIARYLRIHRLIPALKTRLDKNGIAFIPAVTLSFLKETEQIFLDECMEQNKCTVNMKKSGLLRQFSEKRKLDKDSIYKILSGEISQKKSNQIQTVKIDRTTYAKYFQPGQSAKEIQKIIEKALEKYFETK